MTERDLEQLLRDTFNDRAALADEPAKDLSSGVLRKRRTRRNRVAVLAGLSVLAVTGGLVAAVSVSRTPTAPAHQVGDDVVTAPALSPLDPGFTAPPGWRLESSLGVVIEVPEHWATNDYGCGMSDKPSVVRGVGAQGACLTPEVPTKEVAIIARIPLTDVLPERPPAAPSAGDIDGTPALFSYGPYEGGRFAAVVQIPGISAYLAVRTLSEQTTRQIVDSIRLVDVDHVGCATKRPQVPSIPANPSRTLAIPTDATEVSICAYEQLLVSSTRLTGERAQPLLDALRAARPGGNPDAPASQCSQFEPPQADVVLLVRGPDSSGTSVWVTYSGCEQRGMRTATGQAQVSKSLIRLMREPLGGGWSYSDDLPD